MLPHFGVNDDRKIVNIIEERETKKKIVDNLEILAFLGIVSSDRFPSFLIWSFFGGVSVSGCAIGQESALRDLLGATGANRAHTALSMIVGFTLFLLTLIQGEYDDIFFTIYFLHLGYRNL